MNAPNAQGRTRSDRLARSLTLAADGTRGVLLTGHCSDVLVAANGRLMRNPEWLSCWAEANGRDLVVLDPATGGRVVSRRADPPNLSIGPAPIEQLIRTAVESVARQPRRVVLFVDYCCLHLRQDDDGSVLRALATVPLDPGFARRGNLVVLAFRTEPPGVLATLPGWAVVELELPDELERRHIVGLYDREEPLPLAKGLSADRLATAMGGLDADAITRVAEEAYADGLDVQRVTALKADEIRRLSGGTLVVDSRTRSLHDELAGLANLRLHLEECRRAGTTPGAILLAGPPGTGKTRAWLAVATELGVPAIRLGQLRSRYVGDSENNWATARRVLEATAPSCVLIDEADQAGLGHRGEDLDSGVSSRLRAELWDWLNGCHEIGITVIATTNNSLGLDSASLDRLTVLPVLHPTTVEAVQIMQIEANRTGLTLDARAAHEVLARRPRPLTGRQVVRLLERASRGAAMANRVGDVRAADLESAWHDTMDLQDDDRQELMALSALMLADSRSAWPWVAAARLGESTEVPAYVENLRGADGAIDMAALTGRIRQLRALL